MSQHAVSKLPLPATERFDLQLAKHAWQPFNVVEMENEYLIHCDNINDASRLAIRVWGIKKWTRGLRFPWGVVVDVETLNAAALKKGHHHHAHHLAHLKFINIESVEYDNEQGFVQLNLMETEGRYGQRHVRIFGSGYVVYATGCKD